MPASLVRGAGGVKAEATSEIGTLPRVERDGVGVLLLSQPVCNGGRRVERNIARETVERLEGQMIGVRMREQQRVELGQRVDLDSRCRDTRQEPPELQLE